MKGGVSVMAIDRREFLQDLGIGAVVLAGASRVGIFSPLEALAQGAEREFDMLWKGRTISILPGGWPMGLF